MTSLRENRMTLIIVCLVVVAMMAGTVSWAQEKSDEELKKEYAPILGEYEFVLGGQAEVLRFYIEGNALWADSGDGRPATMEPVKDEVFKFRAEDPIGGTFEFTFSKDDQGDYTFCTLFHSQSGTEAKGTKIK
jgi:hypothetical protein